MSINNEKIVDNLKKMLESSESNNRNLEEIIIGFKKVKIH